MHCILIHKKEIQVQTAYTGYSMKNICDHKIHRKSTLFFVFSKNFKCSSWKVLEIVIETVIEKKTDEVFLLPAAKKY